MRSPTSPVLRAPVEMLTRRQDLRMRSLEVREPEYRTSKVPVADRSSESVEGNVLGRLVGHVKLDQAGRLPLRGVDVCNGVEAWTFALCGETLELRRAAGPQGRAVDRRGRLLIPYLYRRAAGLAPGAVVALIARDGCVHLEDATDVLRCRT